MKRRRPPGLHGLVPAGVREADRRLFRRVARLPPGPIDRMARAVSTAANHSVLWVAAAGLLASSGRTGRRAALRGLASLSLASAFVNLPAKLAARRKRPDLDLVPQARRLARIPTSGSFPSGHAASAAAFTAGVALESRARALPVGVAAAAVAYSRVHTGVHYPADVAAGLALGVAAALVVRRSWPTAEPAVTGTHTRGPAVAVPDGEGLVVVVNTAAGDGAPTADRIRALLPRADCRVVDADGGLEDALRTAAAEARVLGIAGGDGSTNAAAAVAHAAGVPLAVFPAGTLNRFAAELGIEHLDDAAAAVAAGHTALVDVADVGGHPFLNSATLGIYPELVAVRERLEDRIGKWPALVVGAVRVLRTAGPVTVEVDGRRRRLWLLFAGNCRHTSSGVGPSSRARLDDGLLDVRLVDGAEPWARARLLLAVLTSSLVRTPIYEEFTTAALRVEGDGRLALSRDGEVFEGPPAVRIGKRATPLPVVVPDRAAARGSG